MGLPMEATPLPLVTVDHIELFVPDRVEAATWYTRALGFRPVPGTEAWATDPGGPLMLSADGGSTKLALFRGQPQGPQRTAGWHRVAFRIDGPGFLAFLSHARNLGLRDRSHPLRVRDHATAFSVYFSDPYGHRLEVTTYDHQAVRAGIPSAGVTPARPTEP
jgi:catechol 2,3-dioxygenase-like lactoylglutathione lyase family enzyme